MTGLSRARARQLAGDQPDPVYWQLVGLPTTVGLVAVEPALHAGGADVRCVVT